MFTSNKSLVESIDDCEGTRCNRGRCLGLVETCDGVNNCEDGKDEFETACEKKHLLCKQDPFLKGCGEFYILVKYLHIFLNA